MADQDKPVSGQSAADAIEAELERFLDAPPSLAPDPSRVHPRVGGKKPGISPLTQQQLALITGRDPTGSDRRTEHGVVVLQSVPASGQAYLEESVRELAWPSGKERRQKFEFRIAEDCSTAGDLRNQVAALRSTKGLEFAILWVPDQLTERWAHDIGDYIKAALERLASGKQARPVVRVLFSLGFQASWGWTTRPEHEPIKRQIAELALGLIAGDLDAERKAPGALLMADMHTAGLRLARQPGGDRVLGEALCVEPQAGPAGDRHRGADRPGPRARGDRARAVRRAGRDP